MDPDFLDPTTDFAFKRVFSNVDVLKDFLNAILTECSVQIAEIAESKLYTLPASAPPSFVTLAADRVAPSGALSPSDCPSPNSAFPRDKSIIYDIVALTSDGRYINVKMQSYQRFYFHHALYYTSKLVSRQEHPSDNPNNAKVHRFFDKTSKQVRMPWNWELRNVYHIGILGFDMEIEDFPEEAQSAWMTWSQITHIGDRFHPPLQGQFFPSDLFNICLISLRNFDKDIPATEAE